MVITEIFESSFYMNFHFVTQAVRSQIILATAETRQALPISFARKERENSMHGVVCKIKKKSLLKNRHGKHHQENQGTDGMFYKP